MIKIILWAIVFYLLYKLLFNIILPVSQVSTQIRTRMKQMQEEQDLKNQESSTPPTPDTESNKGEYIDFEEIK